MPTPSPDPSSATLAILAGGAGSRMGTPKGQLLLNGRPILHALLDRLDWPGPTLLVTAPGRQRPPGTERFSRECVDPVAGQGPLRGLLTALEHAPTPWLVVTAVDMPLVRREQLAWLVAKLKSTPGAAGLLTTRPRVEPFPSAFHRDSAAAVVRGALVSGRRALHTLLDELTIQSVPAPTDWPPETWTNLNRPADLDALRAASR
jgi:molybdopterin-guanine dinucleotide biosynthesis protein A